MPLSWTSRASTCGREPWTPGGWGRSSLAALLIAAVAALLTLAPAASGQAPLACPNGEDALTTYQPDYIREGDTWTASVEAALFRHVQNPVLIVGTVSTPIVLDDDGNGKLVMPAVPPGGDEVVMSFEWDQDLGTQAACHGSDAYTVPYVTKDTKVGNGSTGRLDGSYRAKYTRDEGTGTWRLTPSCALLACNTKLRSSGGLRGTLKLRKDGTYSLVDDQTGFGRCTVRNNVTGEVRDHSPAYTRHRLVVIRQADLYGVLARKIVGDVTDTYNPTAAARADGCTSSTRHSKVTLTRK